MKKLEKGEDYDLIDPATKKAVNRLNTKQVFELMVKMAWKNGEPGLILIDRMNEFNPTPKIGMFESTNPCGEQNLLPNESCNLGSINLSRMLKEKDGKFEVDWEKFDNTVDSAVHFLDNVIDQNRFPLPAIEEATLANRKIGLGVMGWADLLIKLNIPYNSKEAVNFAETVMKFVQERSKQVSRELAEIRGAFPNFKKSVYYDRGESPIRNATTTTIAPTGTISIIAGSCSGGIEPLFALSYYRQVMDNNRLVEVNPYFEKVAKERGFFSRELLEQIAQKGSIQDLTDIPEDVRRTFVISHDITPEWHVRMQAAFQKYTDNAVSKTVNFPNQATQGDVEKVYKLAYKLGCKGMTIYRDRSREEQVLNIARTETKTAPKTEFSKTPRKRPSVTKGRTFKMGTGCGNLYITINEDEEGLCEVFSQMGKSGGCAASQSEATSRLVSLALRSGIEVEAILKQLRGIRCPSPLWIKGGMILSCPDAICKAIEKYFDEKKKGEDTSIPEETSSVSHARTRAGNVVGVCPDCGYALVYSEGCMTCVDASCGYSKCS
jgi:ribonucleoside-diphosphate reductase alpha chain